MYPTRGTEGCSTVRVEVSRSHKPSGVRFSQEFKDVRPMFVSLLESMGVNSVECSPTTAFGGHSYEMAVVMCAMNHEGVFSGIVRNWNDKVITFEPALGYNVKKEYLPSLITAYDIPLLYREPPRS